jgi:2-(1,2-epoxy-1,2-dihydrophenyl)acetyl-CoA isomerase
MAFQNGGDGHVANSVAGYRVIMTDGAVRYTGPLMEFATLLFERRERIAHVTLNRPDRLNALSLQLVEDLSGAAAAIDADPQIRAVLLTGAGRAFCSGADLMRDDFLEASPGSLGENIGASMRRHFNPMVSAWCGLSVPLVVAVNGVAAGAGMSLALAGDIVLAARSATFLQLFAPKLGLMPDLGSTFHLPRLIGTARAKALTLLGDALSAADAVQWGLIWACVDDEALLDQASALTRRLADGPTQAFQQIKRTFNRQPAPTLADQLELEAAAQSELADTRDFAEGVLAFRSKRAPRFTGE